MRKVDKNAQSHFVWIKVAMASCSLVTWCDNGDTSLRAGLRSPWIDGSIGRSKWGTIAVNAGDWSCDWCTVTVNVVRRRSWQRQSLTTLRLWTLVSANLDHALEVDIHRVWELKRLQSNIVI